jgi:hypothetical protein
MIAKDFRFFQVSALAMEPPSEESQSSVAWSTQVSHLRLQDQSLIYSN